MTDHQTLWQRLSDVWPRALYRWNERRLESQESEFVVRSVNLAAALGTAVAVGALGALVTVVSGGAADDGFWVACTLACVGMTMAVVYLCWGGLRVWLENRRSG